MTAIGDKVEYIGEYSPLKGTTGTITKISNKGRDITWLPDDPRNYSGVGADTWISDAAELKVLEQPKKEETREEWTPKEPIDFGAFQRSKGLDLLCGTADDGVVGGWVCSERNFVK